MPQTLTRPVLQARPKRKHRPHKPNSPPKPRIPDPTLLAKFNRMVLDKDEHRLIHEHPHRIIILQRGMTQHRRARMYNTTHRKPNKKLQILTQERPTWQAQEILRNPDPRRRAQPANLLMPNLTPSAPDTVARLEIIEHAWAVVRFRKERGDGDERVQCSHQLKGDVCQRDVDPRPIQAVRVGEACEADDGRGGGQVKPGAVW